MSKVNLIKTETVKPNVVYTIRKQENLFRKENWWKENKKEYYSNILDDKRFIYTFFNHSDANRCLEFLKKYKTLNGTYPTEMSKLKNKKNDIPFNLFIEEETVHYLKNSCLLNNIGLMGIYSFDYIQTNYGKFDVDFKGKDLLENENLNLRTVIHQLDYLLDL